MIFRSVIAGVGGYLPENCVSNEDLATRIDTSDSWISQRTGIKTRHFAAEGQLTSDLAVEAAKAALARAGIDASELDAVIVATTTPDNTFPATAARVQAKLGMTRGFAFDVQAVCSGFVYALTLGDQFIRLGQAKTVLVIGAETLSRILDWTDRTTCVLFGDGAGAVILKAQETPEDGSGRGILSCHLHSDGRHYDLLKADGGPSSSPQVGFLRMEGKEVFRHAVQNLAEVVDEALAANGLTYADIDWLVPHQANLRIIDGTAKKLGLAPARVIVTVREHANTSAASIPLALAHADSKNLFTPGQIVLLDAMGGGFTWGAVMIRW